MVVKLTSCLSRGLPMAQFRPLWSTRFDGCLKSPEIAGLMKTS